MIGASDTAAVLGVGYANQLPITVWNSKVNGEIDDATLKRLKIGRLMEPSLRAIFTDETTLPCLDPGQFTIYAHPELPWLGATLDGLTTLDGDFCIPVELKNVAYFNRKDWDDEPPLKFEIQLQHQLAVTGAPYGYLSALIGGNESVVRKIPRNDRFIAAMLPKLREFWEYVERRELPPVDESEATSKLLGKIFHEDEGLSVRLPPEAGDWALELEQAKMEIKEAEKRKTAAENKLKAAIGTATIGDIPGHGRYSWATQHRAAHHVKATTFRVLRKVKG